MRNSKCRKVWSQVISAITRDHDTVSTETFRCRSVARHSIKGQIKSSRQRFIHQGPRVQAVKLRDSTKGSPNNSVAGSNHQLSKHTRPTNVAIERRTVTTRAHHAASTTQSHRRTRNRHTHPLVEAHVALHHCLACRELAVDIGNEHRVVGVVEEPPLLSHRVFGCENHTMWLSNEQPGESQTDRSVVPRRRVVAQVQQQGAQVKDTAAVVDFALKHHRRVQLAAIGSKASDR